MIKWICRKLGLPVMEAQILILHRRLTKLENYKRTGKRAMRYDEIERVRKRRRKAA